MVRHDGRVGAPTRILVYGVTGSGKSTLALQIADVLGLPLHLADEEIGWLPGWVERPVPDQRVIAERICAEEHWVLDTAYGHWREVATSRAQVMVALDYPRWVSLTWLLRRTAHRLRTHEPVCNGNVETWSQALSWDSILMWHFRSFARKRRRIHQWVADPAALPVVHLRSPRQTRLWLQSIVRRSAQQAQNSRCSASSMPRSAS